MAYAWVLLLAIGALVLLVAWPARAEGGASADGAQAAQRDALKRAAASVVGVQTYAVEDARSIRTLGKQRSGSGIVIGGDDLVLTIGYLILEAERAEVVTDDGRTVPARVVAYDVATGFGLVQALAPLKIEPAPFGLGLKPGEDDPLMIVTGGDDGAVSVARLASRRPFSGYWEYHIDDALFTIPPRRDHSGAGLFDSQGRLLGVGSLFVADAKGADGPKLPGNMFVPVDLLQPILAELRQRGSSTASVRAWLGINCIESNGTVHVVRVNDDSPADVAGLQSGDRIVRIDGREVAALGELWKALWAGGAAEREVALEIQRGGEARTLKVFSVDRAKALRRAEGV